MADLVRIETIAPLPGYRLKVSWVGGATAVVSVADFIEKYAVFEPIRRDPSLFQQVTKGEWGECAHWSDEMEISAHTIWGRAQAQAAE